jgi:hypothetical protein
MASTITATPYSRAVSSRPFTSVTSTPAMTAGTPRAT